MILQSMPPIADRDSRLLILGSMPGKVSLAAQQYYAHPQNRFWKILFRYFGEPYTADYEARKFLVLSRGIALWDSIAACERENSSLDSVIKDALPNDIPGLLRRCPGIRTVITNGRKSEEIFIKKFDLPHVYLPSTSPANASYGFDRLYGIWAEALAAALGEG